MSITIELPGIILTQNGQSTASIPDDFQVEYYEERELITYALKALTVYHGHLSQFSPILTGRVQPAIVAEIVHFEDGSRRVQTVLVFESIVLPEHFDLIYGMHLSDPEVCELNLTSIIDLSAYAGAEAIEAVSERGTASLH